MILEKLCALDTLQKSSKLNFISPKKAFDTYEKV